MKVQNDGIADSYQVYLYNGYDTPLEIRYKVYFVAHQPLPGSQYLYAKKQAFSMELGGWEPVKVEVTELVPQKIPQVPAHAAAAADPPAVGDRSVRAACETLWPGFKSDCSGFVLAVSGAVGVSIGLGATASPADAILDAIASGDWLQHSTGAEAAAAAASGRLVIAGVKSGEFRPPRTHGHVVVVVSGDLAYGRYPHAYWGTLGGVGCHDTSINYAFDENARDLVTYSSASHS